ncbi:MAG: ABC transporter ATP-binding protein [Coprococcus catus]|nr:ABC transporter ATP-binding protein [Coprococcus catus]
MSEQLVEVKDLKVTYYQNGVETPVVRNVSFEIKKNETLGLVGESGSGKSVTSKAIMRLIAEPPGKIANGEILFEGKNLLKMKEKQMQKVRGKDIAMIFQEPMTSLNPLYTCGSQIAEAILLHNKCSKQEAWERAVEILKMVGVPSPEKRAQSYPHELSGGMRQRVMIAIALSCNPRLLIADEPTTALDPTIQAQILKLIHDMQKEKDMSVLLITHDMGIVAENCDRVAVMYAGQILEIADVKTIFGNPAHPYTIGLLKAIPKLDEKVDRLYNIRGMVPRFNELPKGCTFGPRCDFCDKKCEEEAPQLMNMGDGHLVRCHYAGYLPERGI